MATFPTTLPKPTVDNYTLKPVDQTVRTDMEVGAARVRRRTAARNDAVSVVWLFSPSEMRQFREWFESNGGACGGSSWFETKLDLATTKAIPGTQFKQMVTASDKSVSDYFGSGVSVSYDGKILSVGAKNWEGTLTNQGGVYIYDLIGGSFVQRGDVLEANDKAASDGFGFSVALSGNGLVLAVGAPFWEGTVADQGAVYIYDWNGNNWVYRSLIYATDAATLDYFGNSVSLSGDGSVLSVGAYQRDSGGTANSGAVYIYDWNGSAWSNRSIIVASDNTANDYFGSSVSLSSFGDTLIVGAERWEGTTTDQGGVYTFDWNGSTWNQRGSVLISPAPQNSSYFGHSVSVNESGDWLAVGELYRDEYIKDVGAVYLFSRNGSSWSFVQKFSSPFEQSLSFFGGSVSLNGDGSKLFIGAERQSHQPLPTYIDAGAVFEFSTSPYDVSESAGIQAFETRFKGAWEANRLGNGYWKVSAQLEVR